MFNDQANTGYVIVAADERIPSILGYSDNGLYDEQAIPDNMRDWLDGYALQISALAASGKKAPAVTAATRSAVSPLIQSVWAQGYPFNEQCPLMNGQRALTGCVATAMAQLMNYYQWPKQTAVDIPAHRSDLSTIPAGTEFKWANMLNDYGGTRASLGEAGMDVALIPADAGYHIETLQANSATDHYLGTNLYCDAAPTVWKMENNLDVTVSLTFDDERYLSYDGSSTILTTRSSVTDDNAKWLFKTRDDILNDMKKATTEQPVDVSMLIGAADFGRNDTRLGRWRGAPVRGGSDENMCGEKYSVTFDVYQEIENIPNGTYKLSAQAFYREGDTQENASLRKTSSEHHYALLYANEVEKPVMSIFDEAGHCGIVGINSDYGYVPNTMTQTSSYFSSNLYENSLMVQVTDHKLRIGIKKMDYVNKDWTILITS